MLWKCQFCPCEFVCREDLDRHLSAFGKRGHNQKFRKLHETLDEEGWRLHSGADDIVWKLIRALKPSV